MLIRAACGPPPSPLGLGVETVTAVDVDGVAEAPRSTRRPAPPGVGLGVRSTCPRRPRERRPGRRRGRSSRSRRPRGRRRRRRHRRATRGLSRRRRDRPRDQTRTERLGFVESHTCSRVPSTYPRKTTAVVPANVSNPATARITSPVGAGSGGDVVNVTTL